MPCVLAFKLDATLQHVASWGDRIPHGEDYNDIFCLYVKCEPAAMGRSVGGDCADKSCTHLRLTVEHRALRAIRRCVQKGGPWQAAARPPQRRDRRRARRGANGPA